MSSPIFEQVVDVLGTQFQIERSAVQPQSTLQGLGLDSLSLMEFVFAVEADAHPTLARPRIDEMPAEQF